MSHFSEDYLHYLLAQASNAVSASFHAALAQQGIAVGDWRVLASLHPDLRLSVGELAEQCLIPASTLSRTLDRLERDELLARHHDARDRRQVRVQLSPRGQALADQLVHQARAQEQQILASYDAGEIQRLKDTLRELCERTGAR